jgi:hypothetical protein
LQLCSGLRPFADIDNEIAMTMQIFQGESPVDYHIRKFPKNMKFIQHNKDILYLIRTCLTPEHKQRPTAAELCGNKFFNV